MVDQVMLRFARQQDGFSLVEVLVVIVIVGLLAAIALPMFLSHQKSGRDATAKSDARNLSFEVEACNAEEKDFTRCDETSELGQTGLAIGTGAGEVRVSAATSSSYTVEARSQTGNRFRISRDDEGTRRYTCDDAGKAGCRTGGEW